jgi:hypothetical protein
MATDLSEEQSLILDLVRRESDQTARDRLTEAVCRPLDWNAIFMGALWHKVAFLVFENLKAYGLLDKALVNGSLPLLLLNHWKQLYQVNSGRNRIYLKTLVELASVLRDCGLDYAVSKGGPALFGRVYTETSRKIYDIDLIARKADFHRIEEAFGKAGFAHLDYRHGTGEFVPIEQSEIRKWLLHTRGLPNFVKKIDCDYMDYAIVQVQFKVGTTQGVTLNAEALLEKAGGGEGFTTVCDEDLLIQLILHIYRETREETFEEWNMSWNLIKFCDLDRFAHYMRRAGKLDAFHERLKELKLEAPAAYSLSFVNRVFPDPIYAGMLERIAESDPASARLMSSSASSASASSSRRFG